MRKAVLCVGVAQRGTGAASSATSIAGVVSATRRIRSVVASDNSSVGTLLAGAVGPSGCSSSSDSEAAYGALLEDFRSRRSSNNACESKEQCGREEHDEQRRA